MANTKAQIKQVRKNHEARKRNQSWKSRCKTAIRRFRAAADAGDRERAMAELQVASRKLDKAVTKGAIHKNQAANRKSAMARRANGL